MIHGSVTRDGRPIVVLPLLGPLGTQAVEATVDTGFNGWMKLTPDIVRTLGLPSRMPSLGQLADGQRVVFERCEATVIWDGQPRPVRALIGGGQLLVGTRLLSGYELSISFEPSGHVTIIPVS